MNQEKKTGQPELSIEISEELAEGVYSNLAVISHSPGEFILDFVRIMPNTPKAKVKSRIIITPEHAKRFMGALKENIARFEAMHGPIKEGGSMPPFPMNFNAGGQA